MRANFRVFHIRNRALAAILSVQTTSKLGNGTPPSILHRFGRGWARWKAEDKRDPLKHKPKSGKVFFTIFESHFELMVVILVQFGEQAGKSIG